MYLHLRKVHFFVKNQKVHFSQMQVHSGMAGNSLRIQNSHFLKDLLGEKWILDCSGIPSHSRMCLHLRKVHFLVFNEKVHFSEMQVHSGMAGNSLRIQNSLFLKDFTAGKYRKISDPGIEYPDPILKKMQAHSETKMQAHSGNRYFSENQAHSGNENQAQSGTRL